MVTRDEFDDPPYIVDRISKNGFTPWQCLLPDVAIDRMCRADEADDFRELRLNDRKRTCGLLF